MTHNTRVGIRMTIDGTTITEYDQQTQNEALSSGNDLTPFTGHVKPVNGIAAGTHELKFISFHANGGTTDYRCYYYATVLELPF